MRAVAVIPWFDSGCRYRLKNFERVEDWYRTHFDGRVVVGEGTNRGECRNNGFRNTSGDVYLFGDADILPENPQRLHDALLFARENGQLYIGFDRLFRENSLGIPGEFETGHKGGILIISRESFEKVNGFPELDGWGFEDLIFYAKCRALLGPPRRINGYATHLWHPTNADWNPNLPNRELCREYDAAVKFPFKMAELVERDRIEL